jgi:EF-P beta-lysylation protein EpmB
MRSQYTTQSWQEALSDLITNPAELLLAAQAAARLFPLKVPRGFVARMEKGNPNDPLLRQVLPLGLELNEIAGYFNDPLQEREVNPISGLLHKYEGRVLVTLTSVCAIHCRYCFRRHFPYAENNPGQSGLENVFAYIGENPTINEVILSGGDPLAVSERKLKHVSDQLALIPHVTRLRIHTRLAVVLPERITSAFLEWITQLKCQLVIVIHANHPKEINADVQSALKKLRDVGVTLLNQSVLLKGINDDVATLKQLSELLFNAGVLPYYLHVLDKVQGAAHYDLDRQTAKQLHAALANSLPGYLVPKLTCEEPGAPAKTILSNEVV